MTEPELPAHWSQLEPWEKLAWSYDQHVMEIINSNGWMIQHVMPVEELELEGPSFQYTVGMTALDHPEFIVFSLPPEVAQDILNDLGARVRDGQSFSAGPLIEVFRSHRSYLLEVDQQNIEEYLTMANRLYPEVRALQLVWPDQQDRLPWEAGYAIDPGAQPILGRTPQ